MTNPLAAASIPLCPALVRLAVITYACIAFFSVLGFVHPKLRRPESLPVRQAINSWWPPALFFGLVSMLGAIVAVPLCTGISAWALAEYLRMLPEEDRPAGTTALAFAAVPVHYGAIASGRSDLAQGALLFAWVFLVMPLARALRHGPAGLVAGAGRVGLGIVLTVLAFGYVARLFMLPVRVGPAGGQGLAALLLSCVMWNDAGQYIAGKLAGRHPMAPVLSPKKTWEGFAGGVILTALVGAAVAPVVTPLGHLAGAIAGVALSPLGLLGDLLVSAIKRDRGVKDSGKVLPGQGGVLDRADSFLLTAPLYYYAVTAWLT